MLVEDPLVQRSEDLHYSGERSSVVGMYIVKVKDGWQTSTLGKKEKKASGTTRFGRAEGDVTGKVLNQASGKIDDWKHITAQHAMVSA